MGFSLFRQVLEPQSSGNRDWPVLFDDSIENRFAQVPALHNHFRAFDQF